MDVQNIRRTVVVGVDGSDSALRAVRWGVAEAGRRQAPLRLVIAFGWTVHHVPARPGIEGSYRDTLLARAREQLAEAGRVAESEGAGIEIELQLVVGSPIQVLAAEAERAQLLVIGDRGLTSVEGLLVGSVAIGMAAHASCPVVVVRGDERDPSEAASLPVLVGVDGSSASAHDHPSPSRGDRHHVGQHQRTVELHGSRCRLGQYRVVIREITHGRDDRPGRRGGRAVRMGHENAGAGQACDHFDLVQRVGGRAYPHGAVGAPAPAFHPGRHWAIFDEHGQRLRATELGGGACISS